MSDAPRIVASLNPSITPEQVRDTRARAWAYIFDCWHAKKGVQHDLTRDSTKEYRTRPDKKGMQNADLLSD